MLATRHWDRLGNGGLSFTELGFGTAPLGNLYRAISDAEAVRDNQFKAWTPRLLKAAYNYQAVMKDPAGYVHNPTYLLQLLHDSLESLSTSVDVDMASISRP